MIDKHTPVPWSVSSEVRGAIVKGGPDSKESILGLDKEGYAIAFEDGDAEFIVHCVNSHDRVIDIVRKLLDRVESGLEDSMSYKDAEHFKTTDPDMLAAYDLLVTETRVFGEKP